MYCYTNIIEENEIEKGEAPNKNVWVPILNAYITCNVYLCKKVGGEWGLIPPLHSKPWQWIMGAFGGGASGVGEG